MSFVKDNGGMIAVVTTAMIAAGAYSELRIRAEVPERVTEEVGKKLNAIQAVSPDRVKAVEDRADKLEESDVRLDDKIGRIIDILLEE